MLRAQAIDSALTSTTHLLFNIYESLAGVLPHTC